MPHADVLFLVTHPPPVCSRCGDALSERPAPLAKSFPFLVERLCREEHAGNFLEMQRHTRVSHSALGRWIRGDPGTFHRETVEKLCRAYGLPLRDVWRLIQRDELLRIEGERVPLPDISWVRVGPKRRTASRSRRRR